MGEKRNTNYDILDKILSESGIRDASTGRIWVAPDSRYPDRGYWADTAESVEAIQKSNDALEEILLRRFLRS